MEDLEKVLNSLLTDEGMGILKSMVDGTYKPSDFDRLCLPYFVNANKLVGEADVVMMVGKRKEARRTLKLARINFEKGGFFEQCRQISEQIGDTKMMKVYETAIKLKDYARKI